MPRIPEIDSENAPSLARFLGWFSIALGTAELLAPEAVSRAIGLKGRHAPLLRLYGVREIATGIGLLRNPESTRLAGSRVAGDALDAGTLAREFVEEDHDSVRLGVALASVVAVAAVDALCARKLKEREAYSSIMPS